MTPAMLTAIGHTIASLEPATVRAASDGRGFLIGVDFDAIELRLLRFYSDVDTSQLALLQSFEGGGWPQSYC